MSNLSVLKKNVKVVCCSQHSFYRSCKVVRRELIWSVNRPLLGYQISLWDSGSDLPGERQTEGKFVATVKDWSGTGNCNEWCSWSDSMGSVNGCFGDSC